ncbi:hypothetical protein STEG23_034960 [Scotinomys teguina]
MLEDLYIMLCSLFKVKPPILRFCLACAASYSKRVILEEPPFENKAGNREEQNQTVSFAYLLMESGFFIHLFIQSFTKLLLSVQLVSDAVQTLEGVTDCHESQERLRTFKCVETVIDYGDF